MESATNPHIPSYTRPYRSKRHPPCDSCRRKKLRCQAEKGNSCQRCQTSGSSCTFGGLQVVHQLSEALPDANQASPPSARQVTAVQPVEEANLTVNTDDFARCHSEPILSLGPSADPDSGEVPSSEPITTTPATYHFPERPPAQAIQTLDQLKGFSYQVIGASGESDPWLLRHCKFDDHGFLLFHQVHFRNAGGVPLDEKIPVHFLVTTDDLYGSTKKETAIPRSQSLRDELNSLVPLDCGQKLVALLVASTYDSAASTNITGLWNLSSQLFLSSLGHYSVLPLLVSHPINMFLTTCRSIFWPPYTLQHNPLPSLTSIYQFSTLIQRRQLSSSGA